MKTFQIRLVSLLVGGLLVGSVAPVDAVAIHPVERSLFCSSGPSTVGGWRDLFRQLPRVSDGYQSISLGSGRAAWFFGDTARLDTRDFIHNMLVVTCGNQIQQIGTAEAIPAPGDGSFYWGGPPVVDAGKLYVLTPHVTSSSNWPYFASLGTDLATFDLPAGRNPVFREVSPTPSSNRASGVQWGGGAMATNGYVYVYGTYQPAGAWGFSVRVARVPSGKLATPSAWRYWNGSAWTTSEATATDVISATVDGTDSAFSVRLEAGKVVITTKRSGAFSSDVGQFSSMNPAGPFMWTSLAQVPTTAELYTYLASDHPETGLRMLTVNQQPQGRAWPDDIWANPDDYRAQWLSY